MVRLRHFCVKMYLQCVINLQSTMVRLRLQRGTTTNLEKLLFTIHYGEIKTKMNDMLLEAYWYLQSTMVRLRPVYARNVQHVLLHLQSTMVRLRHDGGAHELGAAAFTIHYGEIKTSTAMTSCRS